MSSTNGSATGSRQSPAGRKRSPGARPSRRIGIRELRQHASVYVDLAERGYTVDITNRGRLVARLVPVKDPDSPLERLIAEGIILPAEEPGNLLDPAGPLDLVPTEPSTSMPASEVLRQMRKEERY